MRRQFVEECTFNQRTRLSSSAALVALRFPLFARGEETSAAARRHNQTMRFLSVLLFGLACLGAPPLAASSSAPTVPKAVAKSEPVWEARLAGFDVATYEQQVEKMFLAYEQATGRKFGPGAKHKVGLKIYADSGPGLATPVPLVKGVIAALKRRGFEHTDIFLVGLNALRLRMTGYLPSLVSGQTPFSGNPVYVLESGRYYDPVWFYDSPLPQRFDPIFAHEQTKGVPNTRRRTRTARASWRRRCFSMRISGSTCRSIRITRRWGSTAPW
jgi:hypothetical protein